MVININRRSFLAIAGGASAVAIIGTHIPVEIPYIQPSDKYTMALNQAREIVLTNNSYKVTRNLFDENTHLNIIAEGGAKDLTETAFVLAVSR